MSEIEWVKMFAPSIEAKLQSIDPQLSVFTGKKLPYANEIRAYNDSGDNELDYMKYHWCPNVDFCEHSNLIKRGCI